MTGQADEPRFVRVAREGPVTIVTLARPQVRNALHASAHVELAAIFDRFAADPEQQVAIITGDGDTFSAGHDLRNTPADGEPTTMPASGFGGLATRFDLVKPVIAAVNGGALGGGFELVLACDIVVACRAAFFALPEPRVGLVAMAGALQRLPLAIGLSRARELILTSRRLSAGEAHGIGLIHRLTEPGALLEEARVVAARICEASPRAIQASKALLQAMHGSAIEGAIASQRDMPSLAALLASADPREGARAFVEKRPPNWTRTKE